MGTLHEITEEDSLTRQFSACYHDRTIILSVSASGREWRAGDIEPTETMLPPINNTDLAHVFVGIAANLLGKPHDNVLR
jgi:hypothetical protein